MTSTNSANATPVPAAPPPPPGRRTRRPPPTPAALRSRLEAAVDKLIAALDALDTDPDLEDGHDDEDGGDAEPSLGVREALSHLAAWTHSVASSRLPDDAEPSLGFLECQVGSAAFSFGYRRDSSGDQNKICFGTRDDSEEQHDGREPEDEGCELETLEGDGSSLGTIDDEPSLGATTDIDQTRWAFTGVDDREQDAGDEPELVNEDGGPFGQDESAPPLTEVAALVRNGDGSETVLRHIGDPLKGLAAVHSAIEAGGKVSGILFKAARH